MSAQCQGHHTDLVPAEKCATCNGSFDPDYFPTHASKHGKEPEAIGIKGKRCRTCGVFIRDNA